MLQLNTNNSELIWRATARRQRQRRSRSALRIGTDAVKVINTVDRGDLGIFSH